jgi:hypothetical protein
MDPVDDAFDVEDDDGDEIPRSDPEEDVTFPPMAFRVNPE